MIVQELSFLGGGMRSPSFVLFVICLFVKSSPVCIVLYFDIYNLYIYISYDHFVFVLSSDLF